MELVRGIKITDYCDQHNLPTRDRLDLFIKVCQAIQHAHQKGIIHRDIKPSNILVTVNDGVAVPKVIDFGIAKATNQQQLTDKTLFTAFEQFIGTPAYLSPEQAVLTSVDIDTRCDIYSLGVLLYEMLTGKTPFDAKELLASGIDAMRKTIREKEPLKPSTKLSQTLVAAVVRRLKSSASDTPNSEEEVRASSRRLLRIKETTTLLRGDLDWIVMKCLEKDRARRYETANGLASDIQRHLNNEAVLARPPSAAYRLKKMVKRNKLAFAAVTSVAVTLMLGVVVSTWQAIRATRATRAESQQRIAAQTEQQRAEASARALRKSLYTADMKLAQVSLEEHNRGRALELVEKYARRTTGDSELPNPSSNFKPDFSLAEGDIGDGILMGDAFNPREFLPNGFVTFEADYHFIGLKHSLTVHFRTVQGPDPSGGVRGVITGVVKDGWLKGNVVEGEYARYACPQEEGSVNWLCFDGIFEIKRGSKHKH